MISVRDFAIVSPSPVPSAKTGEDLSRANGSNTCSINSGVIPHPLSFIWNSLIILLSSSEESCITEIVTVPPSYEYFTALLTRFKSI